jgi:hypothetical protein
VILARVVGWCSSCWRVRGGGGRGVLKIINGAMIFYAELEVMLGLGISDRINVIVGALIFALWEEGDGRGEGSRSFRVLRVFLIW